MKMQLENNVYIILLKPSPFFSSIIVDLDTEDDKKNFEEHFVKQIRFKWDANNAVARPIPN